jgi:sulfur carrier protein ThiS
MISLNGTMFEHKPGMTLTELVDIYNIDNPNIAVDDFMIVVNEVAISSSQARTLLLQNNDKIFFAPMLGGG